ncbi:collagen alpha-1(I) chain-like [Oenanthe melanoleuca]|uniref:collagen alpha-1(I) chain-like n=1 Tax=Oenanthe melanoleuca TaxID=2939378 RepID=UPI0024C17BE6|nr:collagen alpha-1(I) chain-like [Oenanthe melanoleuca]
MRRGAVPCGPAPPGAVRCGAVPCGPAPPGAARCGAVPCGAAPPGAVRCGAVRYRVARLRQVRRGAARCGTVRPGSARCGAVRYRAARLRQVRPRQTRPRCRPRGRAHGGEAARRDGGAQPIREQRGGAAPALRHSTGGGGAGSAELASDWRNRRPVLHHSPPAGPPAAPLRSARRRHARPGPSGGARRGPGRPRPPSRGRRDAAGPERSGRQEGLWLPERLLCSGLPLPSALAGPGRGGAASPGGPARDPAVPRALGIARRFPQGFPGPNGREFPPPVPLGPCGSFLPSALSGLLRPCGLRCGGPGRPVLLKLQQQQRFFS